MSAKKKSIPKSSKAKGRGRKKISLNPSNALIVKHTVEKETLFPKKLEKANKLLENAVLLD